MRFGIALIIISFAGALACSCSKYEYVQQTYDKIYRISDVNVEHVGDGVWIIPVCDAFDIVEDANSRTFYSNVDTSLVFWRYRRRYNAKGTEDAPCAVDWRLQSITVEALERYDHEHPAGAILNDILEMKYFYKTETTTVPLISFDSGTLMLSDYYPYLHDWPLSGLSIQIDQGAEPFLPPVIVKITDGFGREFVKTALPGGYSQTGN